MMPTVTKNLIIINVLVFFGTIVAQRYGLDLTNYLGLHFFPMGQVRTIACVIGLNFEKVGNITRY